MYDRSINIKTSLNCTVYMYKEGDGIRSNNVVCKYGNKQCFYTGGNIREFTQNKDISTCVQMDRYICI